jgi:hypothetical protein
MLLLLLLLLRSFASSRWHRTALHMPPALLEDDPLLLQSIVACLPASSNVPRTGAGGPGQTTAGDISSCVMRIHASN